LQRKPMQLSGGQRQRVAIGRALVRDVDVFLFDEPLSNLDAKLRAELRVEIKRLHQRLGNTMIYVTHDQIEAMTLADRIAVMNRGKIEQLADPQTLYTQPASPFVCRFLGEVNELPAALHARWTGVVLSDVVAFVRPHDTDFVVADDASNDLHIETIRDLGPTVRVEARHPALDKPLVAVYERGRFGASGLATGAAVSARIQRWSLFRGDEVFSNPAR